MDSKITGIDTKIDLQKTVHLIASELSSYLAEEVEELNVSSYLFRDGLARAINYTLTSALERNESILVYPESLPGFTLMLFKKQLVTSSGVTEESKEVSELKSISEKNALNCVLESFMAKNDNKVLVIENNDILFALFPVSDTKKNLKELDLYITY